MKITSFFSFFLVITFSFSSYVYAQDEFKADLVNISAISNQEKIIIPTFDNIKDYNEKINTLILNINKAKSFSVKRSNGIELILFEIDRIKFIYENVKNKQVSGVETVEEGKNILIEKLSTLLSTYQTSISVEELKNSTNEHQDSIKELKQSFVENVKNIYINNTKEYIEMLIDSNKDREQKLEEIIDILKDEEKDVSKLKKSLKEYEVSFDNAEDFYKDLKTFNKADLLRSLTLIKKAKLHLENFSENYINITAEEIILPVEEDLSISKSSSSVSSKVKSEDSFIISSSSSVEKSSQSSQTSEALIKPVIIEDEQSSSTESSLIIKKEKLKEELFIDIER